RVAEVRRDAAVFALEVIDRLEGVVEARDRRVQTSAGDEQQREARPVLLVVDADRAFFIEGHGNSLSIERRRVRAKRAKRYWQPAEGLRGNEGTEPPG